MNQFINHLRAACDVTGPNEYGADFLKERVHVLLQKMDAVIYLLDYTKLGMLVFKCCRHRVAHQLCKSQTTYPKAEYQQQPSAWPKHNLSKNSRRSFTIDVHVHT